MKLGTKYKLILCFYSLLPLAVLWYEASRSGFMLHANFQQSFSIAVLTALLVPQLATIMPGFHWLIMSQFKGIVKFCNNLKHDKPTEFNLPVEQEDENEITSLMRSMNWMARKIKHRESDLERRVEQRTADLSETNLRLKKAQKEQEASAKTKSQFLANMSHEIKTPINAIMGMGNLGLAEEKDPLIRNRFQVITEASKSLLIMVNEILDFSKIEAGMLRLENRSFDVRDLAEELLDLFAPQAMEKNLELVAHISNEFPEKILGDPLRLRQILSNLISNAIKFTPHGEVILRVDSSSVVNDEQKIKALFSVTDTGIGIPKEFMGTIFDAFTQADSSTTRRFGGTGLGLAISRDLSIIMGGSLTATSEEALGTRFDLSLTMEIGERKNQFFAGDSDNIWEHQSRVLENNPETQQMPPENLTSLGRVVKIDTTVYSIMKPVKHKTLADTTNMAENEPPGDSPVKVNLKEGQKTEGHTETPSMPLKTLQKLKNMLAGNDMKAKSLALSIEPVMNELGQGSRYRKFTDFVNKYDYKSAEKILITLMEDLNDLEKTQTT